MDKLIALISSLPKDVKPLFLYATTLPYFILFTWLLNNNMYVDGDFLLIGCIYFCIYLLLIISSIPIYVKQNLAIGDSRITIPLVIFNILILSVAGCLSYIVKLFYFDLPFAFSLMILLTLNLLWLLFVYHSDLFNSTKDSD